MDMSLIISSTVSVFAIVVTYAFHRELHPKRRLTYRASVDPLIPPETSNGTALKLSYGGTAIELPYLVTLTLRSQGKADIQSSSFDSQRPMKFDFNAPIFGPLGTPVGRSSEDVAVGVDGTSLKIGPAQLKRDFYLRFQCLCNGPPNVTVRNSLTDIQLLDVASKQRTLAPIQRRISKIFKWSWYELIAVTLLLVVVAFVGVAWPETKSFILNEFPNFGWAIFVIGWAAATIGVALSVAGFLATVLPMRVIAYHDKMPSEIQARMSKSIP